MRQGCIGSVVALGVLRQRSSEIGQGGIRCNSATSVSRDGTPEEYRRDRNQRAYTYNQHSGQNQVEPTAHHCRTCTHRLRPQQLHQWVGRQFSGATAAIIRSVIPTAPKSLQGDGDRQRRSAPFDLIWK